MIPRAWSRARGATVAAIAASIGGLASAGCAADAPATKEQVGELLFNDQNLSQPTGQSCADCHAENTAFRDPESDHSTSMGAVAGRFGSRNAPTAMYARFAPPLAFDAERGWTGGQFWDGRASSLEDQAGLPLLNPLEMNNPDKASVVAAVQGASYAPMFREVFGRGALDDADAAFAHVTEAIAAFERSARFAPFSSKYDRYLAGEAELTPAEGRGLAIFDDPQRGNCASCHPSRPGPDGSPPLFTNFTYANLGIPRYANSGFFVQPPALNPDGDHFIDHGLMTTVGDPAQDGKFRVPTLRNIARTAPYGHNGYFENLQYMVDFIATRDWLSVDPSIGAWPAPEVPATVDHEHTGHLGLTAEDIDDLVAFLGTLSDEPATAKPR
ncbi:MAG TPA: cytochrome c peroxidase [Kofleriaceae bacterium]|nr:cytochrome c peroxidase [Kofleriaceae bacterium]